MAKIAVIKTGGKQYLVKKDDKLKIEKLEAEVGSAIEFETLLVADGEAVEIGTPMTAGKVSAKVIGAGHARTVTGVKYKRKTRQSTRFGHRQKYTEVQIEKI